MSGSAPRLSIIPGWVATHSGLKGLKDLQVLCVLGQNANRQHGWTRRSQVKIAEQLGCARSTVQAALTRLVEIGAVECRRVESESGRDSAHWYRVIYDTAPAEGYDFDAYQAAEDQEYGPISEADMDTPPAGTPAPPAGPASAPPAGPASAPMLNTSCLTPPVEKERESASEKTDFEDRNKIERGFRKWWKMWPTMVFDGEKQARTAWYALSADERASCLEKTEAYVAACRAVGRTKFVAASTYLASKAWERLEDPKDALAPPTVHKPFSRPWMALRFAELLKPRTNTGWPALTNFQKTQMRDADTASRINRERMAKYGWPKVSDMHDKAERAIGVTVPALMVALGEDFQKAHRDSEIASAWKALHERRGWQWLPETAHEWLYFPPGDPEEALARFSERLSEGRGNDDAA